MKDNRGFSLTELLFIITLVLIIIIFGVVLLNNERAKTRDAIRIAHVIQVQYAFEILFNQKNSYAEASQGCNKGGSLVSTCQLSKYLPTISQIKDPGKTKYQMSKVPDQKDFELTFYLEKGFNGLASGKHTLSSKGIK